jgi:hypothetical protein
VPYTAVFLALSVPLPAAASRAPDGVAARMGLRRTLAPAPARKGFCAYEETGEDQDLRTAFAER